MRWYSILRYPGGKAKIYPIVKKIIDDNLLSEKTYVEPFAGGFGLGLKLMINSDINKFIINDLDRHIFCFWKSLFFYSSKLIEMIENTHVNIEEWHKQKLIYDNYELYSEVEVGFSTLFLNRTNYSGILTSGPIGGLDQNGKYKLDCRFNGKKLIETIKFLASYNDRVEVYDMDVNELIEFLKPREHEIFYNFDPPYVKRGRELYLNAFNENDHRALHDNISKINAKWIMTYDNHKLITDLYDNYHISTFNLHYSVGSKRVGTELMIYCNKL